MKVLLQPYKDTAAIAKRCMLCSKRNPDTLLTSILLPALMMILFVSLFGRLIRIENVSYVNYIVPGVLLQCIGQCSSVTSIMISKDMTGGMISRFCTLPIRASSVLHGHILEALVRSSVASAVVMLAAFALGVRPSMGFADLCVFLILLLGSILAISYFAAIAGMTANSAEGASALSAVLIILPYLSSGFVPTETLPSVMRIFAKYQPMTPVIDTMRNALSGKPLDIHTFFISCMWCMGLCVLSAVVCAALFQKKIRR